MGKGDVKTRRGKIFSSSYGKLRPRDKKAVAKTTTTTTKATTAKKK